MATASGTAAFVQRCVARGMRLAMGRDRCIIGTTTLATTPFGLGTYRHDEQPASTARALERFLGDEIGNVVDTSPHYGGAEATIGHVLKALEGRRDGFVVVTKVGHARDCQTEAPEDSVPVSARDARWHSINPDFLFREVRESARLLRGPPDVVLLHNPEFWLADARRRGVGKEAAKAEFRIKLARAFERLENLCADGAINCYGASTNPAGGFHSVSGGLWQLTDDSEALSVADFCEIAESVAGADHRMRCLQTPLNALELGAAIAHGDPLKPSALRDAKTLGVSVMTNRPLHAIPPPKFLIGDWARGTNKKIHLRDASPMPPALALVREAFLSPSSDGGGGGGGGAPPSSSDDTPPDGLDLWLRSATLQQRCLWLAAAVPGVDTTLLGARDPVHLRDLAHVATKPLSADEATIWRIFDRLLDTVIDPPAPRRPS